MEVIMLLSLALLFLVGILFKELALKIKLPGLVGMLVAGILLGPYVLGLLDYKILDISNELRKIALVIILLKAGLSLDLKDLKKVGRPAILLSFLPASFEILGYVVLAPLLLGVSYAEAALMGAVLSAVSPAVVVPRMIKLMEEEKGTKKGIPQMILAGASCDDIFVIVLFSSFLNMNKGGEISLSTFFNIPLSIVLGIALGIFMGILLMGIFKKMRFDNSIKVIAILGLSFLLVSIETLLEDHIAISGLLAVIAMASLIRYRDINTSKELSLSFGRLWSGAEILLFTLVGAAVDIRYMTKAGVMAILLILLALIFRTIGVLLALLKTNLNKKECLFEAIAYLPKATVQAAIGSIPLSSGLNSGAIILSVAVLGIIITAPLGAFAIDNSYKKLL